MWSLWYQCKNPNLSDPRMIELILFCFGTACLSHFMQLTFQKGMIFRHYHNLITYHFALPENNPKKWLFKILGGCIYCNGTWVFIVLFSLNSSVWLIFSQGNTLILGFTIELFLGVGINYFIIDAIGRLQNL